MTRPLRVDVADGYYHVMARGIDRQPIFTDDRDRQHFIELLGQLPERFRVRVHAYVCMDNHYHLIVQTPDANLSRAMHWFNVSYSAWFNKRWNRTGPLFQGRFKSVLIESVAWAYELSVYVHLNPLRIKALGLDKRERAGARQGQGRAPSDEVLKERLKKLRSFRWSSYRAYAGYVKPPEWLDVETVRASVGRETTDRACAYRHDVRARLVEGADPDKLDAVRDRVAIGSAAFLARVKQGVEWIGRESSAKRALRERIQFSEIIQAIEEATDDRWETILNRHGDPRMWLVLHLARQFTGMTLAELGQVAGGKDYAAVSIGLRRFDKMLKSRPDLAELKGRVVKMLNVET